MDHIIPQCMPSSHVDASKPRRYTETERPHDHPCRALREGMVMGRGLGYAFDGYGLEDYWGFGAVHAVAADFADFFDYVVAFYDFAEDGVLAGEPAGVGDGDEELAAVGVGAR